MFAPLAVNTEVAPLHIAAGLADAVTVGNGFTVTLTVVVPVHPVVLVPVTVYVVVALGVTVLLAPVPNPPDQLYVLAPLAVNTEVAPLHIAAGLALAVILKPIQLHHNCFHCPSIFVSKHFVSVLKINND